MEVSIKINGTKEITLNPETPLEHEYLPLIKDSEKYLVSREPNSNKLILKLIKEEIIIQQIVDMKTILFVTL